MGFDREFKKLWGFSRKIDPLGTRPLEWMSKYTGKAAGELGHGLGWGHLEREGDRIQQDPVRGIGRAAATMGLLYGGATALGAMGGGAGAGAGAGAEAVGAGAVAPEVAGAGAETGAGAGIGKWLKMGSMANNLMGGGGGQSQQSQDLLRQQKMAELLRQQQMFQLEQDMKNRVIP
jgi:hypothetical protein